MRERWVARVRIMSDDDWRRFDVRQPIVLYTIAPATRYGRFVRLGITAREHLERGAHQAPEVYGSGATFYLMEQGDEWVIVAWTEWVT